MINVKYGQIISRIHVNQAKIRNAILKTNIERNNSNVLIVFPSTKYQSESIVNKQTVDDYYEKKK